LSLAFVTESNTHSTRKEGQLQEALGNLIKVENGLLKDFGVGLKDYAGTVPLGFTRLFHLTGRHAALVALEVLVAVATDFHLQPFGEGIGAGDTHPVQSAGDLIAVAPAELGARVQGGHYYFQSRPFLLGVHINRDASAIVSYLNDVAGVDDQFNPVTFLREDLINSIVNDFVNNMMQTTDAGIAYVHSGMSPDGIQALKHLNLFGGVAAFLSHKLLLPTKSILLCCDLCYQCGAGRIEQE